MELAEQLNGGLGSVRLQDRHVQVVHKHNLQVVNGSGQALVKPWSSSGQTTVKQRGEVAVKYWSQIGHKVVAWSRMLLLV